MKLITTAVAAVLCFGAIGIAAQPAAAQRGGPAKPHPLADKPTPRMPDGHPDLSGIWGSQGENDSVTGNPEDQNGNKSVSLHARSKTLSGAEDPDNIQVFLSVGGYDLNKDGGSATKLERPLPPIDAPYKPELVSKIRALQKDEFLHDPAFRCGNPGVPRLGLPLHVFQNNGYVILIYAPLSGLVTREIPTDGRKHDPNDLDTYTGDSVGHWEGDTLVIDSIGFNDETWFGNGYFHSDKMHVVERLTRKGDTLTWSATVEDPTVLTAPYNINPRTVDLVAKEKQEQIVEMPRCEEREQVHMKDVIDK